MTTIVTGLLCWRDFHPLEWQLASLHRILAYITGTVDQELLLRNEYLAAENRILMAKLNGRLCFSDVERATLGEIGFRLGPRALSEVATAAQPVHMFNEFSKLILPTE
jgi:putative transposase